MSYLVIIPLLALQLSPAAPRTDDAARIATPAYSAVTAAAPHAIEKKNPETARLKATIDSMIVVLEAKEYRRFLERFVEPAFRDRKGVDAIMEEFEEEKAELLLAVLKEVRSKTPTYSRRGTAASYKFKKRSDVPRNKINFIKVDGLWYLRND